MQIASPSQEREEYLEFCQKADRDPRSVLPKPRVSGAASPGEDVRVRDEEAYRRDCEERLAYIEMASKRFPDLAGKYRITLDEVSRQLREITGRNQGN